MTRSLIFSRLIPIAATSLFFGLAGCDGNGGSNTTGGEGGSGAGTGAGGETSQGGSGGETSQGGAGGGTGGMGQGGGGDCDPAVAEGVGGCEKVLGYKWNGAECVALSGCSCEGAGCASLTDTLEACLAAHEGCQSPPVCEPQTAEGAGDPGLIGIKWNGNECVELIGCKCDGAECEKLFDTVEACKGEHLNCVGTADKCAPMMAEPVGDCALALGVKWNGNECLTISGCNCDGADCGALYDNLDKCQLDHQVCLACKAQLAEGVNPDGVLGVKWNGNECVAISGCECAGADCGAIYDNAEQCNAAHADCP